MEKKRPKLETGKLQIEKLISKGKHTVKIEKSSAHKYYIITYEVSVTKMVWIQGIRACVCPVILKCMVSDI